MSAISGASTFTSGYCNSISHAFDKLNAPLFNKGLKFPSRPADNRNMETPRNLNPVAIANYLYGTTDLERISRIRTAQSRAAQWGIASRDTNTLTCGMEHDMPDYTFSTKQEAKEEGQYAVELHQCEPSAQVTFTVKRVW